ncbi:transmembrane channel like 6 L homeolog isoform X2 [Xenopus laevis]|uniref:Transmembrane channel-like protein n=1 Tax=Xenopus laevis TaxID=8355 RepID=A0A8J0TS02_XENLA|nr:transmembrane channel like 6 L homeolog isoform X2 [Xenopus laevis]
MSVTFLLDIPEDNEGDSPARTTLEDEEEHETRLGPQQHNVDPDAAFYKQDDHLTATMKILANMPSRTIGRSQGAMLSEYYNRTMRRRRGRKRPSVYSLQRSARPSLRLRDDVSDAQEEQQRLLVSELQTTSGTNRSRLLKSLPLSLNVKRELRQCINDPGRLWRQRNVNPCCSQLRDDIAMGYFSSTPMYYGYYSNLTLNENCSSGFNITACPAGRAWFPYHMPLAYLFTIGTAFVSTCIILVYRMSCSFGDSFRVGLFRGVMAVKVFSSWDFKVTQNRSVQRQRENIHMQLKEMLSERLQSDRPTLLKKQLKGLFILMLSWALCLGSWLGAAVVVYLLSEHLHKDHRARVKRGGEPEVEAMLLPLPLAVSVCNLLLPYMYHALGLWEKLDSPMLEVYVAICRNLILKIVVLGVMCYHWLMRKTKFLEYKCWETFVGQELYRFVIMDLLFSLLDTLVGEFLWRIILEKKYKKRCRTEFDIARNVLELIYSQTLAWLGLLFCPLLPVVQVLKLLLLFYIKKASLMRNCRSPTKPWRASHMNTAFLTLLCFPSFLGASVFFSYTVWSVKPSGICGPFRSLTSMYEAGKFYMRELEKSNPGLGWVSWIHHYLVENTFFLYLAAGVLLIVIYFHIQIVNGQRKIINLLKEQISNEGEDKRFLINRLHSFYEKRSTENQHHSQQRKAPLFQGKLNKQLAED